MRSKFLLRQPSAQDGSVSSFRRELTVVLVCCGLGVSCLVIAAAETLGSDESRAGYVLSLGLVVGCGAAAIEMLLARRRRALFVRDPEKAAVELQRISPWAQAGLLAGVLILPAVKYGHELLRIGVVALAAGFLLPLAVFLLVHLLRSREEIERLLGRIAVGDPNPAGRQEAQEP